VTNSSSTSFIFFGVKFDEVVAEDLFEKAIPPEERTKEAHGDMVDVLYNWADTIKGDIGVHLDWECLDGAVYVKKSYIGLEEAGFDDLPIEELCQLQGQEEEWANEIMRFCEAYGLVPSTSWGQSGLAGWKIALSVNR